jgi:hypothetical protein
VGQEEVVHGLCEAVSVRSPAVPNDQ